MIDKNTIIALVVIFLLVLAFQFLYLRPRLERQAAREQVPAETAEELEAKKPPEKIEEKVEREQLPASQVSAEKKIVSIETDRYSIQISTEGAAVAGFQLKAYTDKKGTPVDLIQSSEGDMLPFEIHFDRLKNVTEADRPVYFIEKSSDSSYTFFRDFTDAQGNAFRLSKTYIFHEGEYMFDLQVRAASLDGRELYLNRDNVSYTLVWGPSLGPSSTASNRYNVTVEGYHEAGRFRSVMRGAGGCSLRRGESRYIEFSKIVDWVGVHNQYFFIGIVPDIKNYIYAFDQRTQDKYFLGISQPYDPKFKSNELINNFRIYAGPKERKTLKKYGYNFESVIGGRVLKPIVIVLEWLIKAFYRLTRNYGIAIILMTVTIKIILHPLTRKSFESMRRMSTLQPKINEIRERYSKNPAAMNKEITALYRREKINPMGGCLPLLLQLPIFYALYSVLQGMIDLRNQSFLWIKDLSLPDTVAQLQTAVPLLGYRLGSQGFTDINILPFIMTATTLLQSKLTSGDQTGQQGKMMTYLFPIIFFFIFWNMPSGLNLYWTIQNVLTIGQQFIIDYRMKRSVKGPAVPPGKKKS